MRKIADDPDNPKMIHNFLGGAVAGAAVCSLSPIELGTGLKSTFFVTLSSNYIQRKCPSTFILIKIYC